jgi:hypothetical protein
MISLDGKEYINTRIIAEDSDDNVTITEDGLKKRLDVSVPTNADGEVVVRNLTADIKWDTIVPTFNATSDVYVFSYGGSTTATITVSYTDATKSVLSGVTKVLA